MRRLFFVLLAVLWSFAPVAPFQDSIVLAAPATAADCKAPMMEAPPPGNPWMLIPQAQRDFLNLHCYFHRQPPQRPNPWMFGTCAECHPGPNSISVTIPGIVTEHCSGCHWRVPPQQQAIVCRAAWCPMYITTPEGVFIAGMMRNPLWP